MSKSIEFCEKAKVNFSLKQGSDEYITVLPEMQSDLDTIYPKLCSKDCSYNHVTSINECPDLAGFNVHYSEIKFDQFKQTLEASTNKFQTQFESSNYSR